MHVNVRFILFCCRWMDGLMDRQTDRQMDVTNRHQAFGLLPAMAVSVPPGRLGSTSLPLEFTAGGLCCFNKAEPASGQMDISWLIFNSLDAREEDAVFFFPSPMVARSANGCRLGIMGGYLGTFPRERPVGLSVEHY